MLKQVAADAVQTIWHTANEAATGELAALRAEARLEASEAEAQHDQARASATERRALREIDRKGEQAVAELRTELAAVQARAQDVAVAGAEARARLQAERGTLSLQLGHVEEALKQGQVAHERLRVELEVALRRADRADAEAGATRRLVPAKRRAPATRTKFKPGSA
ncbi:hypothetical protein ACU4HD_44770 (plasmid) [Cupriavidus basilensis]